MELLTQEELVERINQTVLGRQPDGACLVRTIQPFNYTPHGYEWDIARVHTQGRPPEASVKAVRRVVQDLKKTIRLKPDPEMGLP